MEHSTLLKTAMKPIWELTFRDLPIQFITPEQKTALTLILLGGLGCMLSGHTRDSILCVAEDIIQSSTISTDNNCIIINPSSTTHIRCLSCIEANVLATDFAMEGGYGIGFHDYVALVQGFEDGTITAEKIVEILA